MIVDSRDIGKRVCIISGNSKFKGREGTIREVSFAFNEAVVEIDGTNGMRRSYVGHSLEPVKETKKKPTMNDKSVFIVFGSTHEAEEFVENGKSFACEPVIYIAHTIEHGIKQMEQSIEDGDIDDDFPCSVWFKGKAYELNQRPRFYVDED